MSHARTRFSFSGVTMRLIVLFLEPGAIRMLCSQFLIEQVMHALLCFLQLIVVFSHQVCPLVIVARVGVWVVLLVIIPCSPAFPRDTARIGTFPKVAEQPTALIAEFRVHDPYDLLAWL